MERSNQSLKIILNMSDLRRPKVFVCRVFGTCHTSHPQCGFYAACSGMSGHTPSVVGWIVSAESSDASLSLRMAIDRLFNSQVNWIS